MKASNLFKKAISKLAVWIVLIVGAGYCATAQMPAAITVLPANATAYDEITLIFDPAEACFQSGSLAGLPYISMHSGVGFLNGQTWMNIVPFNGTGFNGQSTILLPTGDGRYSITYIPAEYYALAGQPVTKICAVFNNGTNWTQDGRDFEPVGTNCRDFFIPLVYQWPMTKFHFKANMNKMIQDGGFEPSADSVFVYIEDLVTIRLSDDEQNGIYEGMYDENLTVGEEYICRFRVNEDQYESVIRTATAQEAITYITGWWNDVPDPEAYVVLADYEDGTNGSLFMHVIGCGEYDYEWIHPLSETFYIVDNPYPSALNPSAKVMKFIRRGLQWGASSWGGFYAQCVPPADITFLKYVHVKILKPRISPVRFKLEAGYHGTFEITSLNSQTLVNEWEEVVFDYNQMTGFYPLVAFMPDYEIPLTLLGDIEIYFDDIVLNNVPYPIYVNVNESEINEILIYPNPANDFMVISCKNALKLIRILDLTGRESLRLSDLSAGDNYVNLSCLKPGIFFITATDNSGQSFRYKFLKNQ